MSPARPHIRRTAPAGRRARLALTGPAALLAAALTACSGGSSGSAGSGGDDKAPATSVSVNLTGKAATPGGPVKVTLAHGKLQAVSVTAGKGGALAGKISADGRTWTSERVAAPGTAYTVEAKDTGGGSDRAAFTTAAAEKVNKLSLAPGKNTTVGIAQPLSVVFDHPVKDKAAVEKALKVSTSNGTEGSWGWLQDYSGKDRVDWRPEEYWKPGTKVTLDARLNGVNTGADGGWFVRDYATTFTVGAAQVVEVDLDRHRLALRRDGKQVLDLPMSAGTPGGEKASWRGTAVLMSKEGTINMRSETVGLGDAYDKMVDYSMRLTWSGMYAHAAPWNARHFGQANRSSGCVGMSDADAAALYGQVRVGDPFEMTGAEAKGTVAEGNGYGAWNVSWADWRAKSAL
ncbi:Ig-like domain-containing protein [Streptomyces fimicarius]|uniref:Ig-like domain-containing protein n=1 Tax=Streptomyces caviscabies TaxID=90079 RepID=A0ABW2MF42_9ACTN|nr:MULTISPECIES: Ig-like domain-containing protein [Streptomyces]MCL6288520.1 Ig-like domain-containing protein [Streptomyces sp. 43Y-GA-1]MDX3341976.1 Ig-like domain-containing protein [Streptomyces sp. ME02-6979.5a]MDX3501805.1 Ig-like domain-containing protein [Streptomyces sp. ATCC51928]MDX5523075.1 Ig-like domain-containing protein [Streptomyces sp. DE06-01C]QXR00293.1 L,D-transpeptidase family protein [Streptomyces sp. WY228]